MNEIETDRDRDIIKQENNKHRGGIKTIISSEKKLKTIGIKQSTQDS
jgi:hypothetical protein